MQYNVGERTICADFRFLIISNDQMRSDIFLTI